MWKRFWFWWYGTRLEARLDRSGPSKQLLEYLFLMAEKLSAMEKLLVSRMEQNMKAITDFKTAMDAQYANINLEIDGVKTELADLNEQIATLSGSQDLSADDAATLEQIKAQGQAVAQRLGLMLPPTPAAPAAQPAQAS